MTSIPANVPARQVAVLAYPTVTALDIVGPAEVFATASFLAGRSLYDLAIVSVTGGTVSTGTSLGIDSRPLSSIDGKAIDTMIVPGGADVCTAMGDQQLIHWVAQSAARARRTVSVCTGAFLLAEAGLLDNCRAVTHWAWCDELARRFPKVAIDADPIFIRNGKIWTSAGASAGIDLALALVEEDFGAALALSIARRMVVFLKRPGGQAQFSAVLGSRMSDPIGQFAALNGWVAGNLDADLRVERLADRVGMSPRTFARAYGAATGITPARAVECMRIEAARHLLSETRVAISAIAISCGFGDDERMRRAFLRQLCVTPSDYRARFQTGKVNAYPTSDTVSTSRIQ